MNTANTTPQGYAIELYFDAEMEKNIFSFRQSIYDLGVNPVLGSMGDKPHISLTVIKHADPKHLAALCEDFAKTIQPFSTRLDAVGVFPTASNVLFLTPVPTLKLLEVHRDFHQILAKEKFISTDYYLPGRWIPHCTIEFELSEEQLKLAVNLSKRYFSPIQGTFASLGLIAFRPIQYLAEFELFEQEKE